MKLTEFYTQINGDYTDVITRFGTQQRTQRFVSLFATDTSYNQFITAMNAKDYQEAFRAIHTLKGICLNLGFTSLLTPVSEITELLRNDDVDSAKGFIPELSSLMELHLNALNQLKD